MAELNLIDDFLFSTLMETPEYANALVKLIIKRATGRTLNHFIVEPQKTYHGTDTDKHGIRLDVLVHSIDENDMPKEVYAIEPNAYYEKNIAKRNRYYHALADSRLLFSGDDFGNLPELITIWILPYDPFGDGRMIYSVKNVVTENPSLMYNDGITTLFLNGKGNIGGDEELANLLQFFLHTNETTAVDSDLQNIQHMVHTIKGNPEVGEHYMSIQTAIYYEKKMSYAEGKERGIQIGEERGIQIGEERGIQIGEERLAQKLMELGVDSSTIQQAITSKTE